MSAWRESVDGEEGDDAFETRLLLDREIETEPRLCIAIERNLKERPQAFGRLEHKGIVDLLSSSDIKPVPAERLQFGANLGNQIVVPARAVGDEELEVALGDDVVLDRGNYWFN